MDKSCESFGSGESPLHNNNSSSRDHHHHNYLKQLNKLSHKISKPNITSTSTSTPIKTPPFEPNLHHDNSQQPQQPNNTSSSCNNNNNHNNNNNNLQQQQQHQPPVYNIHKNDFRDVVQKLTGSPAHDRFSNPPPIQPPKPPSTRLHRFRPPPLAHVINRPPPLLNGGAAPPPQQPPTVHPSSNSFVPRPPQPPLSPLPPFPAVHAAAESPVSAYMRYLQNSMSMPISDPNRPPFSGFPPLAPLVSARWNNQQDLAPPQQQQGTIPSPTSVGMIASQPQQFHLPTSPTLPFGCMSSPRSPYPLLSPSLLLSPSPFPLSPTLPVPSPKWRGI